MTRNRLSLLFLAAMFALAPRAGATDLRTYLGAQPAQALATALTQLYPGATIGWSDVITVTLTDGTKKVLTIAAFVQRADANGAFYCAALQARSDSDAPAAELAQFKTPTSTNFSQLIAMRTDAAGALVEQHNGRLADTGTISSITEMRLMDDEPATLTWPSLAIDYIVFYGTDSFFGQVRWAAHVTTDPIAVNSRVPLGVAAKTKSGSTSSDQLTTLPTDATTLAIKSITTEQTITTCSVPCRPDGKALLAVWLATPVL